VGGVTVHAVPQAITQEAFQEQLASLDTAGPGPHVLLVHGTVLGVDGLFSSEFNEYQIPMGALRPEFAYIALGHFHNQKRVRPNAYYAGSPEYCSFNEAGQAKVMLRADVEGDEARVSSLPTGARAMVDLGAVDAGSMDPAAVTEEASRRLAAAPRDGIARVTFDHLDRGVGRLVDWAAVRALRPDLVHLEVRLRLRDEAHTLDGSLELAPLAQEFEGFLARFPLADADRARVRAEALEALSAASGVDRAA